MANGKKWYEYFVSVDPAAPSASPRKLEPADQASAAQAIADIAASIQPLPAAPQMAAAVANPMSFDEIYHAAEIAPPAHGYSIFKVADMLASPHIKNLPGEVKRSSVLVALEAAGAKIESVIEDAIRRDKALDTFERVQQKQAEDFEAAKLEENRKHQAEIDRLVAELKAKIEANNQEAAKRKEAFQSWRIQKQLEEQKIADAVSFFVTENPITTSARPSPAAAKPPAPKPQP
ncbi:MAG: hypothetical protein U0Q16_28340 [Bryobacteraceae bacterium]